MLVADAAAEAVVAAEPELVAEAKPDWLAAALGVSVGSAVAVAE